MAKSTPAGGVRDPGSNAPARPTTGGTTVRATVKPKKGRHV